jgi:serine/threonine protein kinase
MRELQCIIRVPLHPNIVRLFEVHRTASSTLCYVFEYMPNGSIHDLLHARSLKRLPPLPATDVQSLVRQILAGLAHLHQYHHMHRDMKPENILLCRAIKLRYQLDLQSGGLFARSLAAVPRKRTTRLPAISVPAGTAPPKYFYRRERTAVP